MFTVQELDAVSKLLGTMTLITCPRCPWISITEGHYCPCCGTIAMVGDDPDWS